MRSALFMGSHTSRTLTTDALRLGVTGYAAQAYQKLLDELDFTGKTGIPVEVRIRPTAANELLTQMTGAILSGTTPYDVLDFEDQIAASFSQAGWLLPLNELLTENIWNDFLPSLQEMTDTWDKYRGELFRIHHNFELCYWWYRKDWFDSRQIPVPKTWNDVRQMGNIFSNARQNTWASEEAMQKNAYLDVYLSWITCQAGGNPYLADETLEIALQYIYDLMYKHNVLNPACLQKNYDQQNNDYIANRVAFMRQWPFFYDICTQNKKWFSEEKVSCALPPIGPAGKTTSTYAAGWGLGIPKTTSRVPAAKELIRFLIDIENVKRMTSYSSWFLNARHSILDMDQQNSFARYLKIYSDAGIITTRPSHPTYFEAVSKLEDIVSAFLTKQLTLKETLCKARHKMKMI